MELAAVHAGQAVPDELAHLLPEHALVVVAGVVHEDPPDKVVIVDDVRRPRPEADAYHRAECAQALEEVEGPSLQFDEVPEQRETSGRGGNGPPLFLDRVHHAPT